MYPDPQVDLSIAFCGVAFEHPFILAAGPPTDELEMVRDAFTRGWAGAVLKTTTVASASVDLAYPMMSGIDLGNERMMGLGNIDLVSCYHIDEVEPRIVALKKEFPQKRVIVSISGQDEASWSELARRASAAGADLIECSFSCPQGTMGMRPGAMLGQDAEASAKVAGWIKAAAGATPVVIKLTPQVEDIAEVALAVKGSGADAVCVGNTIPALMGVDLASWVPAPNVEGSSTYSGLSGPAVKPISLRCIADVAKRAQMPIAGSGGAETWRDAMEFLLLGASVVEFCTAVMRYGVDIIDDLKEGLASHLSRRGIGSVREVVGQALSRIVSHDALPRGKEWRPKLDADACVRCGQCVIACYSGGHRAIELDAERKPVIDDAACVGCGLCSVICPAYCLAMEGRTKTTA